MKHINFEAIDCEDLCYTHASDSWCCTRFFVDLDYVDFCVRCKFAHKKLLEDALKKNGVKYNAK